MRSFLFLLAAGLAFFATGCGDDTSGSDSGRTDGGITCMSGMHDCSGSCVPDQINDPSMGCRRGCGDPCPAPTEGGMATCTSSGLCDVQCTPPYRKEGDTCRCAPQSCSEAGAMCGSGVSDGCGGTIDCGMCGMGRMCDDMHQCVCTVDDAEPNDEELQAYLLVPSDTMMDWPDTPDTMATFSAFTLNTDSDVDIYRVRVRDTGTAAPTLRVELRNIPPASDFSLGAFFRCDSTPNTTRCDEPPPGSEMDGPLGRGCVSDNPAQDPERVQLQTFCGGGDESGNLFIEVRSSTWMNACMPYELTVLVE